jgi:hypothetical protein
MSDSRFKSPLCLQVNESSEMVGQILHTICKIVLAAFNFLILVSWSHIVSLVDYFLFIQHQQHQ